jgi:CheY-like chemotaxis protein
MTDAEILIVDDEEDTARAVTEMLAPAGFAVGHASNGLAGLEYLRTHGPPAMILLDWSMPLMDGPEMMEKLQADPLWRSIPVVLFTADPDAKKRAVQIRAAGYLKKPCAAFDLMTMVDNTVRHPSP